MIDKDDDKSLKELTVIAALVASTVLPACGSRDTAGKAAPLAIANHESAPADSSDTVPPYTGTDKRGVPRYAKRSFSAEERGLLRRVYGIEDPSRLYISDSSDDGLLKYDTQVKKCRACYVNSYRIGFVSIRRSGESWDQLEKRVRTMPLSSFSAAARTANISITSLDPEIQSDVRQMLEAARSEGFVLRVAAAYRSPEREAYLMARGGGATHTLTSLHSYGRAIDVIIGDGNLSRAVTRQQYIAFRRWVTRYKRDEFRILGTPAKTWDWAHVEVPSASIGFPSIEAALSRARSCGSGAACDFQPHLPRAR